MAYQQSRSSLKQTGYNNAGQVVAALINAGLISSKEEAATELKTFANGVFEDLNEEFETEAASAPSYSNGNGSTGQQSGGGNATNSGGNPDPGSFKFKGQNKYAGKTVAQVAIEAPDYLEWYLGQDNPKMAFMQKIIREYFDTARAGV